MYAATSLADCVLTEPQACRELLRRFRRPVYIAPRPEVDKMQVHTSGIICAPTCAKNWHESRGGDEERGVKQAPERVGECSAGAQSRFCTLPSSSNSSASVRVFKSPDTRGRPNSPLHLLLYDVNCLPVTEQHILARFFCSSLQASFKFKCKLRGATMSLFTGQGENSQRTHDSSRERCVLIENRP